MNPSSHAVSPAEVTLANWRLPPYSAWSFHNVDALVPVASIPAGDWTWPLDEAPQTPPDVSFADADGRRRQWSEVMAATATRGLVVLKSGRILSEWYGGGYDGRRPHLLYSVSKSISGLLAGILVEDGALDPDAPVTRYVPEAADSAYGDCTLRHVLDMTVSSSFDETYTDRTGDYARYRRATLWNPPEPGDAPETLRDFLCTMPRAEDAHGHIMRYLSPNSDMLGWIIERAARRPFAALASERLWQPMGAEADAYVTVDAEGSARSAGGICARPRDLARLGEMMRLGGRVAGRQVVPGDWIADIRGGGDPAPWQRSDMAALYPDGCYRSQWYITGNDHGAFGALGIHGQWLWVDPTAEVVIAKVSNQPEPADDPTDLLLIRAFEALCEALV